MNFDSQQLSNSTWTVPQTDFQGEYDTSRLDDGNSFRGCTPSIDITPLSDYSYPMYGGTASMSGYDGTQTIDGFSPIVGGLSPSSEGAASTLGAGLSPAVGISPPFNGLSPLSPQFHGLSPISSQFNGLSPISPSFKGVPSSSFNSNEDCYPHHNHFKNNNNNKKDRGPTYLTSPSILSGGSFSYGTEDSNGLMSQEDPPRSLINDDQRTFLAMDYEGNATLVPDFKSLMISDGLSSQGTDSLDLNEIDSSFNEETFSDLDQYIHNESSNENSEFASLDDYGNRNTNDLASASLLSIPCTNASTLEDCMLKKITTGKRGNRVRHPQSWEFLVRLLLSPQTNPSLIKWENKEQGIFRLVQKEEIAKLWGKRSQKHKDEPLAYDNFARILRYHYRSKVLRSVSDKHLVYQLGDKVLENLKIQGLLK